MNLSNSLKYIKLSQNFHLLVNPIERYKTEFNLHTTAAGAYFEEEGEKGVSHLLEHCMVAQTRDYSFTDLQDLFFKTDIYHNAYTGRLWMDFVISGHKSDYDLMLDLLLNFSLNTTLSQDVLDQEREIVLKEISQHSGSTGYRLNRILINAIFETNSYSMTEVLGSRDDVKAAKIATFEKLLARSRNQSHYILTAAGGDVNVDQITEKLSPIIERLQPSNLLTINYQPKNFLKKLDYLPIVTDLGHEHAVVNIVIPCTVTLDNRPTRAYLREMLFESPAGILYNTLRNKLGLIYSLNYSFDITSDTLSLELSCEIKDIKKIISEIKELFTSFESVVTSERMDVIKNLTIKRRELNEDNPQFAIDFMTNVIADYGVILYFDEYIYNLQQTDLEDLKVLFTELKNNIDRMQIVVVSNKKEIEKLKFN